MITRPVGGTALLIVALSMPGSVAGALLGMLIFPNLPVFALVVIMLVGAALSALMVSGGAGGHPSGGTVRDAANPGGASGPPGGREPWASSPAALPPPPKRDGWSPAVGRSAETARLVLPVDPSGAPEQQWWGQSSPPRPTRPEPGAPPPAPELTSYVDSARIVQCPRCGEFRIDVTQAGSGYAFRCRVDNHRWEWQAGTPWPTTIKVSRRRPDPRRDDQAHAARG